MRVEVYGSSGCKKCSKLKEDIQGIVDKINKTDEIEVVKVEDPIKLAEKGIMSTPAVAVDGEVKSKGRVPSESEIKEFLM